MVELSHIVHAPVTRFFNIFWSSTVSNYLKKDQPMFSRPFVLVLISYDFI